ncbi:MAG TPA: hypothetical protein VGB74_12035, partial [Actinoplanes sp.]
PADDDRDKIDDLDRGTQHGADDEVSARDEESDSTATTYGPDGSLTTTDGDIDRPVDQDADRTFEQHADRPVEQDAVKDEGTFDGPTAVDPATGEPLDVDKTDDDNSDKADSYHDTGEAEADTDTRPATAYGAPSEDKVDGADDTPVEAVPVAAGVATVPTATVSTDTEPAETVSTETGPAETGPSADAAPVVTAVAVPAATATTSGSDQDRFFPDGDGYADRFREIQLTFVDSPKEATTEASALVGEALDKLTGALKERKESLDDDSEDTEKLRVALRGYRDLLNRLLSL